MQTREMFDNGHHTLMQALDDTPEKLWEKSGVCGIWSVKDILIHITAFEIVLGDLLLALEGVEKDTKYLQDFIYDVDFNDKIVLQNRHRTVDEIRNEYLNAHQRARTILAAFPDELVQMQGLIAWYGSQYDLDDFIAYTYYGHKVEHAAQIQIFNQQQAVKKPAISTFLGSL